MRVGAWLKSRQWERYDAERREPANGDTGSCRAVESIHPFARQRKHLRQQLARKYSAELADRGSEKGSRDIQYFCLEGGSWPDATTGVCHIAMGGVE